MRSSLQVEAFARRFTNEMAAMRRDGRWPEIQESWTRGFMVQFFCGLGMTGFAIAAPKAMARGSIWVATGFVMCVIAGLLAIFAMTGFGYLRRYRRRYAWCKGYWPLFMTTYDVVCLLLGTAVGCLCILF